MIETLKNFLSEPIQSEPLALFRIAFGLLCAIHFVTPLKRRKIIAFFRLNKYPAPYAAFRWLPTPGERTARVLVLLRTLGFLSLAAGIIPSASASLCFVTTLYLFLADQTRYCNFEYFCLTFLLLFIVVDSGAAYTVHQSSHPIPYWHLLLFQLQFLIIYTYAALAKVNRKWLLEGLPLRFQFERFEGRFGRPTGYHRYCGTETIANCVKTILNRRYTALFFCWGGLILELLAIPFLWTPTMHHLIIPPFIAFHLFNSWFLAIGAFPGANIAAILLFLSYGTEVVS